MFIRAFFLALVSLIVVSCGNSSMTGSNYQSNMEKLDKIYGKCRNPYRQYKEIERRVCEDKQRAAGPDGVVGDPINVSKIMDRVRGLETTRLQ